MRPRAPLLLPVLCSSLFAAPPNIILILCDDLGCGDVGCYGAKKRHAIPAEMTGLCTTEALEIIRRLGERATSLRLETRVPTAAP